MRQSFRRALTLVELLVVVAVIMLLVGLVALVSISGVREGQMADATSRLRQIGLAVQLYVEQHGDYPLENLDALVTTGLLSDPGLLRLPSDISKPAFESVLKRCHLEQGLRTVVPTYASSFESVFVSELHDGLLRRPWLEMVEPHDQNPGLVVTRIFGTRRADFDGVGCAGASFAYQGRILRLRADGSVERGQFIDVDERGNRRNCYPGMFTDVSPSVICQR